MAIHLDICWHDLLYGVLGNLTDNLFNRIHPVVLYQYNTITVRLYTQQLS